MDALLIAASFAQTATAVVAVITGLRFVHQRRTRRTRLENYLCDERMKDERERTGRNGAHTIVHLMGQCLMTEAQVLEAAFANRNIKTWISVKADGVTADYLMFQYCRPGESNAR